MSFILKQQKEFIPCPDGVHMAVCVDVVDLGLVESIWNKKVRRVHKLRVVWQVDTKMDNGKPFMASKRYTVSLDVKSNLRKDLKTWRGVDFTPEELAGFDIEKIIHAPAQIVVTHDTKDGKTFANVVSVIKAAKGTTIKATDDYVRVKDRPDYVAPQAVEDKGVQQHPNTANQGPDDCPPDFDEDCPF